MNNMQRLMDMTLIELAIWCFRGLVLIGIIATFLATLTLVLAVIFPKETADVVVELIAAIVRGVDAIELGVASYAVVGIIVVAVFVIATTFGVASLLLGVYDTQREILAAIRSQHDGEIQSDFGTPRQLRD